MSKYKILFQISGSIAAYKSAYLISKLVQNNFEVQTVITQSALQFIGKATLEGLTGKPVLLDTFEESNMMSHIELMKWADLIILAPASANTINKMANGIADNLVTSLFLAHKWDKPYLIAPAMNTAMFKHPATQKSLQTLIDWGVIVLPTDAGYLACGDYGEGKLLDPDKIYDFILKTINKSLDDKSYKGNVLITAGATREFIDGVRFISNISTGKTASAIADYFIQQNYNVTFLHGINSLLPSNNCIKIEFGNFESLLKQITDLLTTEHFDFIIHLAAVSDYTIDTISTAQNRRVDLQKEKLPSDLPNLSIQLRPTPKIVDRIKSLSKNKNITLVAFKFSAERESDNAIKQVKDLIHHSGADYIVLNNLNDRTKNTQVNFKVYNKEKLIDRVETADELAKLLDKLLNQPK